MNYIIFDMDDTLLDNNHQITPYTLQTLKALQAMGHKIVINTARSKQFDQEFFDQIRPDYAILNGGALIVDKDENAIFRAELSREETCAFIRELLTVCDDFTVYTEHGPYSHLGKYDRQGAVAFDFTAADFPYAAQKVVATIDCEADAAALAEHFSVAYVSYFGGPFRRFNHPEATKARGNRNLMATVGATLADVIAFGDDLGDIEMLQQAGLGVLMCNAKPELHALGLRMSRYDNDNDGVARFLRAHFGMDD